MQKRIISGVVMFAVVAIALILGLYVNSTVITVFIAVVAALGVNELVGNAAEVNNIVIKLIIAVYTVVMVFMFTGINHDLYKLQLTDYSYMNLIPFITAVVVTVVYFVVCAVFILINQAEFDLAKIAVVCAMPLFLSYAFSTIGSIIIASGGIYYLLLVLNFSCVCDMGAYFVGVNYGSTKLCPNISPNKTVEGALGGIVSSVVITLVITLCYGYFNKILPMVLLTVPICVVGMIGDLFASIIKRKVGIKDYGSLIPGHGGILDRVDSILFISSFVFCLMLVGII